MSFRGTRNRIAPGGGGNRAPVDRRAAGPDARGPGAGGPELDRELPLVSVVMPIRNEAGYIQHTLDRILGQDYPANRIEIVVADGMSDDGTREVLDRYVRRFPRIRVIDNPARLTPTGLNLAIAAANGPIISRIDGHCEVARDFIRQNVRLLAEHPEAWGVGGPIVHAGRSWFGKAAAVAMAHPAGVGMATHRFAGFEGYVEGTAFPVFRRWVFDRVGWFDEQLVRNQDDEFTYRIGRAGGKIYASPRVRYVYYVRDRLGRFAKQYFQYSFWRIPVMRKHRRPTTYRQIVPPIFFLMMLLLLAAGIWMGRPIAAVALPIAYASVLIAIGVSLVPRHGPAVGALVPVAIATMHAAYAAGFAFGLYALLFDRQAWDSGSRLTTISR